MKAYRITYHDGTSHSTEANSDLEEFTRYLKQAPHVTEDQLTGKETVRYVTHVEELPKD